MSSVVQFLFDNWIDLDKLANTDVSSEQSAFPIENAFNLSRRSKVWRSAGYWKTTSTNNQIVFKESSGGPLLTAVIPVASYNTTASFMAAIKAAMELVSVDTFTVTQNSNYRFVIASSGSYLQLVTTNAGFTSAGILGFDTGSNYTGLTLTADLLKIHTSEWILWDMGIASQPNAFALIQQRNQPINITESALIELKGNFTNPPDWDTPEFSTVIPYDSEVIAKIVENYFDASALRYWRLEIVDQNPVGYISVGAFFLGVTYAPVGCAVFPLSDSMVDLSETTTSEGGQTFSDQLPKTAEYGFQFNFLNKTDVETIKEYWDIFGTSKPFFILLDKSQAFSTSINRRLKYVKFSAEPDFELFSPGKFSMSVKLREEL